MSLGIYTTINTELSNKLKDVIPSNFLFDIFTNNPLIFLLIFFVMAIIIAMTMKLMSNMWKLPFAILVDLIDLLAISSPGRLDIIAAVGSFILILLFVGDCKLKKIFLVLGSGEALIGHQLFFAGKGMITSLFPINTILVFISIFLKKE